MNLHYLAMYLNYNRTQFLCIKDALFFCEFHYAFHMISNSVMAVDNIAIIISIDCVIEVIIQLSVTSFILI